MDAYLDALWESGYTPDFPSSEEEVEERDAERLAMAEQRGDEERDGGR
jgi:hypothetical protein